MPPPCSAAARSFAGSSPFSTARTADCIAAMVASSCSRMSCSASATASCAVMSVWRPAPSSASSASSSPAENFSGLLPLAWIIVCSILNSLLIWARAISTARSPATRFRNALPNSSIVAAGSAGCASRMPAPSRNAASSAPSSDTVSGCRGGAALGGAARGCSRGGTAAASTRCDGAARATGRGGDGAPPGGVIPSSRSLSQSSGNTSSPGMTPPECSGIWPAGGDRLNASCPTGELSAWVGPRNGVSRGSGASGSKSCGNCAELGPIRKLG